MTLDLQAIWTLWGSYEAFPIPAWGTRWSPQTQCAWAHGNESCWHGVASPGSGGQSGLSWHHQRCRPQRGHSGQSLRLHFESAVREMQKFWREDLTASLQGEKRNRLCKVNIGWVLLLGLGVVWVSQVSTVIKGLVPGSAAVWGMLWKLEPSKWSSGSGGR